MSYKHLTKKELLEIINDLEMEVVDLESNRGFDADFDCNECDGLQAKNDILEKEVCSLEEKIEEQDDEIRDLEGQVKNAQELESELASIANDLSDIQYKIESL